MRSKVVIVLFLMFGGAVSVIAQDPKPESVVDRASYGIGHNMGHNFVSQGLDINVDLLVRGLRDALAGGEPLLSDEEIQVAMQEFQRQVMEETRKKLAEVARLNQEEGVAFLAANAVKDDVIVLESGLQYRVVAEGDGAMPASSDTVRVHYEGRLIDGSVFDSSYERGQPAQFPVVGVIPGWVEALQLMKVGSKWELFIPSDLAYGENGRMPQIGPNSTLVFDVELLGIVDLGTDE